MYLIFYLALLFTLIICSENRNFAQKKYKKVQKDIFKLKITEDEKNYVITMRSKYYFPIYATWYSENNVIDSDFFYVENIEVIDWLRDNLTDQNSLDKILNNLTQHFFVLKISKNKFIKRKKNLNCCLDLLKIEDFQNIMTEYWNKIALINDYRTSATLYYYNEIYVKIGSYFKSFGLVYANSIDEMPNLNDYEVVRYENEDETDRNFIYGFLKNCLSNLVGRLILSIGLSVFLIHLGTILYSKFIN